MKRLHGRPNLSSNSSDNVFGKLYNELIRDLRTVNMWSFEYIASTYIRLLELSDKRRAIEEKRRVVEGICKRYETSKRYGHANNRNKYLDEIACALYCLGFKVISVKVVLKSRGAIGTSSGFGRLLFEWGISFDPYMNTVYIPASAIKGAVRAAYRYLCIKSLKDEKQCKSKEDNVFGSTDEGAGLLAFTDAYPIALENGSKYMLVPDVITPHYTEKVKYEKDVVPTPIVHLSINKGVVFRFLMYYTPRGRRSLDSNDLTDDLSTISSLDDLKLIDKSILLAFGMGVGAKTLTGYSQFTIKEYKKYKNHAEVCRGFDCYT